MLTLDEDDLMTLYRLLDEERQRWVMRVNVLDASDMSDTLDELHRLSCITLKLETYHESK